MDGPPPCKSFFQRFGMEDRLLPSIRPVDAARRLLALMRSADRRPIKATSSVARWCTRVWPIPVRPVVPSRCQSPSQTEGEPDVPRSSASYGDEPAALSHPVLSLDPNLFVRSPGPPLRPDLSFPGAPRAADGKAGPPGPPPEAAACRSEHGAILPPVGIRGCEWCAHGRLTPVPAQRPRQACGSPHRAPSRPRRSAPACWPAPPPRR